MEALLAAKKIIANPHGYTETSVLVAEALIGQVAQSIPVVGEAVAWAWNYSGMIVTTDKAKADAIATLADSGEFRQHNVKVRCLYEKPTTSITAQELDALRKDAERYRWLRDNASYSIHEMLFGKPAFSSTHKESDLDDCIDANNKERQS